MGSVKDLEIVKEPTKTELGEGIFRFSNRYSVFDWGKMPDQIPHKGKALCVMAAWNFERLEEQGINTHYLGLLDNSGRLTKIHSLREPSNNMVIKLSRVIMPKFENGRYDYSFFTQNRGKINNFVVPLENIYRRGAPEGSSLFDTIAKLEREEKQDELRILLTKYGLTQAPKPGDLFPQIGYDFTTKFESDDRKLGDEEAYKISGLTEKQFETLKNLRNSVADFVGRRAEETGLADYDGKQEYILFNGTILLADVVGTLDENRIMLNGHQISKEILRQVYKTSQPGWHEGIIRAKEEAKKVGVKEWKSLMKIFPQRLKPRLVNLVGEMYAAGADRYTGLNLFKVRSLEKIIEDLRNYN